MLALADLGASISETLSFGYFAKSDPTSVLCIVQAAGIQFFEVSSFAWTTVIAIHLYLSVVWTVQHEKLIWLFPCFFLLGFALPLIPLITVLLIKGFGNSSIGPEITWCVPLDPFLSNLQPLLPSFAGLQFPICINTPPMTWI